MDPKQAYTDDQIWDVVDKCKLKELIPSLDTIVEDSGTRYSSGQKQQVCLARAALAKCKILVLDEATANMDHETSEMLMGVIDEVFSDCTVLTIAHRLPAIINCDKVLVLDHGRIVEFDSPKKLSGQTGNKFYKMWKQNKSD